MLKVGDGQASSLTDRIDQYFNGAEIGLAEKLRHISSAARASGKFGSGSTLKLSISQAQMLADVAVAQSLEAFERACRKRWASRKALKSVVRTSVIRGVRKLEDLIRRTFLEWDVDTRDLGHVDPLFAKLQEASLEQLDDHFSGWSGPALQWTQRHPVWTAVGSVAIALIVAVAGDLIANALLKALAPA